MFGYNVFLPWQIVHFSRLVKFHGNLDLFREGTKFLCEKRFDEVIIVNLQGFVEEKFRLVDSFCLTMRMSLLLSRNEKIIEL